MLKSDYEIEGELNEVAGLFGDDLNIECSFLENSPFILVNGEFYHVNIAKGKFSRNCKAELYRVLSQYTGKTFEWGALTGVRPTKLGYELLSSGEDIIKGLMAYGVCREKALLVQRVISNQSGFSRSTRKINLYVHIPFCPSRCNYCSFISLPVKGNEKLMDDYVDYLVREIESGVQTIEKGNYIVDSIYIGGGTPTALNEAQLKRVLSAIPYRGLEYTVEAGRPDTITEEKLRIMSESGVTRISINPQSFSDKTLSLIGRAHTSEEIIRAYNLAKGNFIVNMDLIAGLSGETEDDFRRTVKIAAELGPQNITVHTLARKNGSRLKERDEAVGQGVANMVKTAYRSFTSLGYEPYYLYRQKNMLENLENIGYARRGYLCANNITTMEEFYSVFACGAGAISKRIKSGGLIERHANLRDVKLYIEQFDERLEKKIKFFL